MNIAIIAATGKLGKILLERLMELKHSISVIVRDAKKVPAHHKIKIKEKNIFNLTSFDVEVFDVVISAYGPSRGQEEELVEVTKKLIDLFKGNKKTRVLICGCVGPMYLEEQRNHKVADSPHMKPEFINVARAADRAFQIITKETSFDWTYIAPPLEMDFKGKRSNTYKTANDVLPLSSDGKSYISYEDFALALIDEIIDRKITPNKILSVTSF